MLPTLAGPALAADPQAVVELQKRGEAFLVEAHIDVAVARRTAWEVLTDFDHMGSILSNLTASRVVSREGNTLNVVQQGTVRYGLFSFSFASEREVRLEPMKRIVARQIAGTAKAYQSEMQLVRHEQGIELRYQIEIVPDSALARVFGASFVEHEVAEQLAAMAAEMIRRTAR